MSEITCSICGKPRTPDVPSYTPIQAMTGQPLGWYSGDDGEICPKDIAELMGVGNRITYRYYGDGS